ncbi:metal-sulfur cluster assembly factor [Tepidibacillus fermentans]|uniref:metal-sulfur cluster assembly factor n=1 Tax=Tepidibacillus fermentans TaxID=1281767 RepID=UPI00104F64E7|nr:iron-sulfur cluster assembly protein [Tepidibacillus fermentans]
MFVSLSDELQEIAPIDFEGIEDENLKQEIIEALMEVNDPEINIDIINLGLVYKVQMDEEKNVKIQMTLTAIGCPLAGSITGQVQQAVGRIEGINQVHVDLVWNPPWDRNRVSRLAKMALGIA